MSAHSSLSKFESGFRSPGRAEVHSQGHAELRYRAHSDRARPRYEWEGPVGAVDQGLDTIRALLWRWPRLSLELDFKVPAQLLRDLRGSLDHVSRP